MKPEMEFEKSKVLKGKPKKERKEWYLIKNKTSAIATFTKPKCMTTKPLKPFETIRVQLTSNEKKQAGTVTVNLQSVKRNDIEITKIKE